MPAKTTIPPQLRRLGADGRSDAPKHVQLSEAMRAAVASGHWRTGERLPTEVELARALPFSLGTVQRALRELSGDGTVVRRQRSGTFVAAQRTAMTDPWHCRFLDDV